LKFNFSASQKSLRITSTRWRFTSCITIFAGLTKRYAPHQRWKRAFPITSGQSKKLSHSCPERDAGFVSKMKHFSGAIDPALRETADAGSSSTTT
jgi:hypothetical protein